MCDSWNLSLTLNDLKIAIPVNTNLFFSIPIQNTKKNKNKKQNEAIQIKAILCSYFYIHSLSFAILLNFHQVHKYRDLLSSVSKPMPDNSRCKGALTLSFY